MSKSHRQLGDILRMAVDEDWLRFDPAVALYYLPKLWSPASRPF